MAQREGSRTPHEGTIEFISLDSHKGAGGSLSDTSQSGLPQSCFCGIALWSWHLLVKMHGNHHLQLSFWSGYFP